MARRKYAAALCFVASCIGPHAAVAAEQNAAAQDLPLDFTWSAPEGCPTRQHVIDELSRAVDPGGKELPPLLARAVVSQDGAAWRLELTTEMDGRRGTRQLEADSCEGLARAATLVLALTLGEGLARRQAEAEAKAAAPPPPPPPPPAPPPRKPPPAAPHVAPRGMLWLAASAGSDPLHHFGPGLALGAAFRPSVLMLGARLEATLPHRAELRGSGGELRSFSAAVGLEACLAPKLEPLIITGCANGSLTLLSAAGHGTARDSRANVPLYSVGPSLAAHWLLSDRAFLTLALVSHFFVVRPELVVSGLPQRTRIETASFSGQLGGGVRF